MVDVASFLGADRESALREMSQVLEFEIQLANFSLPREQMRNASKLYNPMQIRDLTKLDPNTPWLEYINRILTPEIIQVKSYYCVLYTSIFFPFSFLTNLQHLCCRSQETTFFFGCNAICFCFSENIARSSVEKYIPFSFSYVLPRLQKKKPVDFDDELKTRKRQIR